ncbi:hypothetical protein APY06_10855 [Cutibacterium avidum]|nr:hypothetical protein APY06_10855 [Cutibacterium avidum]
MRVTSAVTLVAGGSTDLVAYVRETSRYSPVICLYPIAGQFETQHFGFSDAFVAVAGYVCDGVADALECAAILDLPPQVV